MEACALAGVDITVATPPGYEPDPDVVGDRRAARRDVRRRSSLTTHDPLLAVAGRRRRLHRRLALDGRRDDERAARADALHPYQVNAAVMAEASPDAVFMHCLPAHRGEEVAADVIDGPHSVVLDQAENRMHTAQALLIALTLRLSSTGADAADRRSTLMLVVIALGGNALLRRGEPLDAAVQRANVEGGRRGDRRDRPRAPRRAHARQRPAGRAARPPERGLHGRRVLPARRPRRRDRGHGRLPPRAGARAAPPPGPPGHAAHPGRRRPRRPRLRRPDEVRRSRLRGTRRRASWRTSAAGRSPRTATSGGGSSPSPEPQRIVEMRHHPAARRPRRHRDLRGRRRHPGRPRRPRRAARRRSRDRQGPLGRAARHAARRRRPAPAHRRRRACTTAGAPRHQRRSARPAPTLRSLDLAGRARWAPRSTRSAGSSRPEARWARSAPSATPPTILDGEAGTIVRHHEG